MGNLWFSKFNLSRDIICFISRLKSNHTRRGEHLSDKNITQQGFCKCGREIKTLNHMFFNCDDRKIVNKKKLNFKTQKNSPSNKEHDYLLKM